MKTCFYLKYVLVLALLVANFSLFSQSRKDFFKKLDYKQLNTNVLYNLAKSHSDIEKFNGSKSSPLLSSKLFKQIYYEINSASIKQNLPDVLSLSKNNSNYVKKDIYPIYILDYDYDIIKKDAFDSGLAAIEDNKLVQKTKKNIFEVKNVFVASTISERTYSRLNIKFLIKKDLYFSNRNKKILYFLVDFDNGKSEKKVNFDEVVNIKYLSEGIKNISVKAIYSDHSFSYSHFKIKVKDTGMPTPNDLWENFTADIPYNGEYGVGDVAIFLGDSNTVLTEPIIVVDGFDPNDERPISGVYEIANQQHLVDSLHDLGMDAVIVNFNDGAGYIQKNAFLFVKVVQTINQIMTYANTMLPANQISVIGPSMGGLITRYGLTYMEQQGMPHNVRNWISFDSPQKGANIPLGVQHWVRFFADEAGSEGALESKEKLSTPAAKQMLYYHFTATSGNTANPNPMKINFYNELNSLGFPQQMRTAAIINGSGYGQNQSFFPGEQVIYYHYTSFQVDLDGNVWTTPNHIMTRIFQGLYDTALPYDEVTEDIYVNNTLPFDGAPGGTASTFNDLDETDPGYGDIIAYYDDHCFIPTISSLDLLNTSDPLFNVNANIDYVVTPFDTLYYPYENQPHVYISPESLKWFIHEIYNFRPQFTSTPPLSVNVGELYSYAIKATDENEWNNIDIQVIEKPNWLTFDTINNILSGTPSNNDVGEHNVEIEISDGLKNNYQSFAIQVINGNNSFSYQNPTTDIVNIEFDSKDIINIKFNSNGFKQVYIVDEIGRLVYSDFTNQNFKSYDLSSIEKGMYFIYVKKDNETFVKKIILY